MLYSLIHCSINKNYLTVVSQEEPDGPEVLLEPAPFHFPPSKTYQTALYEAGIPVTQFNVENVQKECDRLMKLDVAFSVAPKNAGTVIYAIFNDICGNKIQNVEVL